ncbi:zinc finger protein 12-like isoform X1 [Ictalurus furcatus]|uniref:zinc finger protein 12-like isoform X1 n=1 Tax=Ictalurus furcatus TaxID=66913 RepID=UPI0023508C60|nr:zinc finger protein 12-like isoform X1 [Ictalurus furcatus]
MAQYTFQEQLLSVMEILAKAATEEINRRVADSCAVIRIELSRSQRDIDSLKRKCQVMENELKKVRGRGRRKVFICSSSEKIPFQSACARDSGVNACSAEQPVPPTQEDPEGSTQQIRQTIQILEDRSAATAIKEEGNENDPWSSGEAAGQFPYGCHGNKPHNTAQEISEEQNRFSEEMARQRTHLTHIGSPVTSNEEHPSSLRLQVKSEKEEAEEKEVAEVIVVEGSEQRRDDTNHPEFAYNNKSNEAERTDKSFTSTQLSCDLSLFSQPVEVAMEQSGNDAKTIQNDQIEMYGVGQVSVHEQTQPTWCRDRAHEAEHMVQRQRHDGLSAHQQHRTLSRPSEAEVGAGMASQTGSNIPHQAFLGRGRGGLRRFRTQWVTSVDGERRFRCSFCERTFVRFGQLKEHMRSHTGERPYTCSQCGRSFTKQGNLIRHAVVHSGEKPYQCSLCGKCFTQRSSLKSHQKTHMPDRDTVLQGLAVRQLVREQHDSLAVTQTRGFV